jgi:NAD(P)-dependent dehydrogenase (short-subunit alcohol dehydrogenase family)
MVERGEGYVINISSNSARLTDGPPPFPWSPMGTTNCAYGATKAALDRYTNVLGVELYGTGVRVNALLPVKPVASEGAMAHLGDKLDPDRFNPVEVMVQATVELARCAPELTARICTDGPLLDELGVAVRTLDGTALLTPP